MRRFLIVFSVLVVCVAASVVGVGAPLPRAAAADPVIAAAGDIACPPPGTRTANRCHQAATADLLAGATAVLPLGDEQYNCGELDAFNQVYDPSWGRFKGISNPVVGDNEYVGKDCSTPGAEGYFRYFGAAASPLDQQPCFRDCKGYYSYDVGSWHMVALNSECTQPGVGGCSATSPQVQWLNADLAAHRNTCTLAYFHRPYFSDNGGTVTRLRALFTALYNGEVDVLLVGHDHIYERFRLQNPSGGASVTGIRQFIVGTGGRSSSSLAATPPTGAQKRNTGTFGVLKLTLHPTSYDWQFDDEANASKPFTDSGSQACTDPNRLP
jgi:hypothetical protein